MLNQVISFFWKHHTGFDETIITFTDQNGWPLEIEDKVSLAVLINKKKWCDIL